MRRRLASLAAAVAFALLGMAVRDMPGSVMTRAGAAETSPEQPYIVGRKSRDGTGKYYLGREIATVMAHEDAGWLDRPAREREENPRAVIESLALAPDTTIADIGAGTGYFTFMLAPKVPRGKVYAVDIQQEMLDRVRGTRAATGVANVETVLGRVDDANLPDNTIDVALLVDSYHEFAYPREMLASLYRALRPGGRVFLVEYRAEDPSVRILPHHKMTEAQARKEFAASDFRWQETLSFLPKQHVMVFRRP